MLDVFTRQVQGPLGRSRRKWEENIKMYIRDKG
jgi:hypothetical protein